MKLRYDMCFHDSIVKTVSLNLGGLVLADHLIFTGFICEISNSCFEIGADLCTRNIHSLL